MVASPARLASASRRVYHDAAEATESPSILASSHAFPQLAVRQSSAPPDQSSADMQAKFADMQGNLMRHIVALEVLLSLLLFNMVLMGAYLALRHMRRPSKRSRHGELLPSATSSMTSLKLPSRSPNSSHTPARGWPSSPQRSIAAFSPTPPSRPATPMRDSGKRSPAVRRAVTPEGDFLSSLDQLALSSTAPSRPALAESAGVLDSELLTPKPASRADRTLVMPVAAAPVARKPARRTSVPRSALGSSTVATDAMSDAVGSGASYPTVSDFISRLQNTYPQQEIAQYRAAFSAQGIFLLDELRGVSTADLRTKIRGMTSSHADFFVRAIQHELDWIDADKQRGGIGFRMVLSS